MLNTSDNTLSEIVLENDLPWSIALSDQELYVTHYDIIQRDNYSDISIINLETKEARGFHLNHAAQQIIISEDSMYILGDWKIYRYSLDNMSLEKSAPITKMSESEVSLEGPKHSYLTGLFLCP